jgi:hypothetical protein
MYQQGYHGSEQRIVQGQTILASRVQSLRDINQKFLKLQVFLLLR